MDSLPIGAFAQNFHSGTLRPMLQNPSPSILSVSECFLLCLLTPSSCPFQLLHVPPPPKPPPFSVASTPNPFSSLSLSRPTNVPPWDLRKVPPPGPQAPWRRWRPCSAPRRPPGRPERNRAERRTSKRRVPVFGTGGWSHFLFLGGDAIFGREEVLLGMPRSFFSPDFSWVKSRFVDHHSEWIL